MVVVVVRLSNPTVGTNVGCLGAAAGAAAGGSVRVGVAVVTDGTAVVGTAASLGALVGGVGVLVVGDSVDTTGASVTGASVTGASVTGASVTGVVGETVFMLETPKLGSHNAPTGAWVGASVEASSGSYSTAARLS